MSSVFHNCLLEFLASASWKACANEDTPGMAGHGEDQLGKMQITGLQLILMCSALTWVLWDCALCWKGHCPAQLSLQEVGTIK